VVPLPEPPPDETSAPERFEFAAVFEEHQQYVWRALRYLGVAERDLADVTQEVFVVVHERLPSFRGESKLRTWIYGIALNHARAWKRKAAREQLVADLPEQTAPEEPLALRRRLLCALDALDDDKRAVFVLHELEQYPMNEVAHIVGCELFTAYARHRAARKKLAAMLEAER
jgi:RNA polymerase sigma-70 factor, ECF subfamily